MEKWVQSQISHAVSDNPIGPFHKSEHVVKAPFAHNPTVHKTGDGIYVIYHIGDEIDVVCARRGEHLATCNTDFTSQYKLAVVDSDSVDSTAAALADVQKRVEYKGEGERSQYGQGGSLLPADVQKTSSAGTLLVSMLVSPSPVGPWQAVKAKVTGAPSTAMEACNNPAAYHNHADGSVLLYCKVKHENLDRFAVFKADHWRGPYNFVKMAGGFDTSMEDAYIWHSKARGAFHMIYHTLEKGGPGKR